MAPSPFGVAFCAGELCPGSHVRFLWLPVDSDPEEKHGDHVHRSRCSRLISKFISVDFQVYMAGAQVSGPEESVHMSSCIHVSSCV